MISLLFSVNILMDPVRWHLPASLQRAETAGKRRKTLSLLHVNYTCYMWTNVFRKRMYTCPYITIFFFILTVLDSGEIVHDQRPDSDHVLGGPGMSLAVPGKLQRMLCCWRYLIFASWRLRLYSSETCTADTDSRGAVTCGVKHSTLQRTSC